MPTGELLLLPFEMTPQERQILQEAEDQAFETSQQLNDSISRGVRPEPKIEESESSLEAQAFGLDFIDSGGDDSPSAGA